MDQTAPPGDEAYAKALGRINSCHRDGETALNLRALRLSVLPPEIGQLTELTELILYDNYLSVLPPEIGQLTELRELNLARNQLGALPPEIGQLTELTRLDLSDNQLSTLPP